MKLLSCIAIFLLLIGCASTAKPTKKTIISYDDPMWEFSVGGAWETPDISSLGAPRFPVDFKLNVAGAQPKMKGERRTLIESISDNMEVGLYNSGMFTKGAKNIVTITVLFDEQSSVRVHQAPILSMSTVYYSVFGHLKMNMLMEANSGQKTGFSHALRLGRTPKSAASEDESFEKVSAVFAVFLTKHAINEMRNSEML